MPLKKKEEVCGKPNQYNLQTLEYDWRELPDTHVPVAPQRPRIRDYSPALPAGGAARPAPLNPITHQPLVSNTGNAPRHGAGPSYTPLPSPSRPVQEDLQGNDRRGRYGHNNNQHHVSELLGGAAPSASPAQQQQPMYHTPSRLSPAPPTPSAAAAATPRAPSAALPPPLSPMDYESYPVALDAPTAYATPTPAHNGEKVHAGVAPQNAYVSIPWSHEDLKRMVTYNTLEAQRSYLR